MARSGADTMADAGAFMGTRSRVNVRQSWYGEDGYDDQSTDLYQRGGPYQSMGASEKSQDQTRWEGSYQAREDDHGERMRPAETWGGDRPLGAPAGTPRRERFQSEYDARQSRIQSPHITVEAPRWMRSARGDDTPFDAPPPACYGLPRFGTDPQRPIGARGPGQGRWMSAGGAGMRLAPRLSRGEATPRAPVSRPSSAPGARLPPLMRGTRGTGADCD